MAKEKKINNVNGEEFSDITLLAEVTEVLSKNKNSSVNRTAEFDVQYPTGFLPLDYKNGQKITVSTAQGSFSYDSVGIVDGSINMFIGRSGCGKSTIVTQIAANIVRGFSNGLIFIDLLEGGVMAKRNEILTGFSPYECERRIKIRNAGINIESVYAQIKAIHDVKIEHEDKYRYDTGLFDSNGRPIYKFQPTVYIIDSIPMLTSFNLSQEEELSGQMSTTANTKQIAMLFKRIGQLLKEANIIIIAINHITQKIEINPFKHTKSQNKYLKQDESLPGGVTPLYLANMVFRLDDGDKLTSDKEFGIEGCYVTVSNVKSRAATSGMSSAVDLIFNYSIGFDPELSLYVMLKKAGRINGAGAYLYIGDRSDMKFSQKQFKSKLIDDPEFLNVFVSECTNYLTNELDKLEEMCRQKSSNATALIIDRIRNMSK